MAGGVTGRPAREARSPDIMAGLVTSGDNGPCAAAPRMARRPLTRRAEEVKLGRASASASAAANICGDRAKCYSAEAGLEVPGYFSIAALARRAHHESKLAYSDWRVCVTVAVLRHRMAVWHVMPADEIHR